MRKNENTHKTKAEDLFPRKKILAFVRLNFIKNDLKTVLKG
jgi:hypothetical protein